jgi:hypothetical protein
MIAEYAGHNGHADLLRERINGATGLLAAQAQAAGGGAEARRLQGVRER